MRHGGRSDPAELLRIGAAVVPVAIFAATVALWLSLRMLG
jgi:hypothetical protein